MTSKTTTIAFSIGAAVPADEFRQLGKELRGVPGGFTDTGRGNPLVCPDCGICVCGGVEPGTEPSGSMRIVRCGTLDDTSWLWPTTHFYVRNMQPWVGLPEDTTVYETASNRG